MSWHYTSSRNMEFVHRLHCYDNSNANYLTTIQRHFACMTWMKCVEAHTSIIPPFWPFPSIPNRIWLCETKTTLCSTVEIWWLCLSSRRPRFCAEMSFCSLGDIEWYAWSMRAQKLGNLKQHRAIGTLATKAWNCTHLMLLWQQRCKSANHHTEALCMCKNLMYKVLVIWNVLKPIQPVASSLKRNCANIALTQH